MTGRADDKAPLALDDAGIVRGIPFHPSPNHDERPAGTAIELLVIHSISLPPGEYGGRAIDDLFLNRLDPHAHPYFVSIATLRVSAHFLIRRDGALVQFVPCSRRAWHAGESSWRGRPRCNDYSIGIELEGSDAAAFEDPQYEALAALSQALVTCYPIVEVQGHADVAPGRKSDPGPWFDWRRYRASLPRLAR